MSNTMPTMAGKNPPPPRWRPHGFRCPDPKCRRRTLRWRQVIGYTGTWGVATAVECKTCGGTFTRAAVEKAKA